MEIEPTLLEPKLLQATCLCSGSIFYYALRDSGHLITRNGAYYDAKTKPGVSTHPVTRASSRFQGHTQKVYPNIGSRTDIQMTKETKMYLPHVDD